MRAAPGNSEVTDRVALRAGAVRRAVVTVAACLVLAGVILGMDLLIPSRSERTIQRWKEHEGIRQKRREYLARELQEEKEHEKAVALAEQSLVPDLLEEEEPPAPAPKKKKPRPPRRPRIIRYHPYPSLPLPVVSPPPPPPDETVPERSVAGVPITMYMTPT